MGIEINADFASLWQSFAAFMSQDPVTLAIQLFLHGGWVIFLMVVIVGLYKVWLDGRQGQYASKWKQVLLAIDIPRNNEQTPKAVENIFAAIAATQSSGNLIEQFWEGKIQESFSFEVISLEGYIQFLIRTPSQHRDLVEAAVYAQYPDAEIVEIEDYTKDYAPIRFPNDKYNLWGTEFLLTKDYPFPIRSYTEFEHSLSQSFLDPMAGLLEILSRFGPGEQVWLQLVITPQAPPGWGEKAKKVVKEMSGQPYAPPPTMSDKLFGTPIQVVTSGANIITKAMGVPESEPKKKEEDKFKLFNLSPGDKSVLESVQRKLSKHAFRTKFRLIYLGEKEVFNKGKGVGAVIGAIQQFNTTNANGFKPGKRTKTGADYFNVKKRVAAKQNKILRQYIKRDNFFGDPVENMFLNTEELATVWHFPVMTVKAPSVEKIVSKKVIPPTRLPLGTRDFEAKKPEEHFVPRATPTPVAPPPVELPMGDSSIISAPQIEKKPAEHRSPEPPSNLPIA